MDLGSFFGGIGNWLGGAVNNVESFFGGGQKKKDPNDQPQAQPSFQSQPQQQFNTPGSVQFPQPFSFNNDQQQNNQNPQQQNQPPKLGGIHMAAPQAQPAQQNSQNHDPFGDFMHTVGDDIGAVGKFAGDNIGGALNGAVNTVKAVPDFFAGTIAHTFGSPEQAQAADQTLKDDYNGSLIKPVVNTLKLVPDMGASALGGITGNKDLVNGANAQFQQDMQGTPIGMMTNVANNIKAGVQSANAQDQYKQALDYANQQMQRNNDAVSKGFMSPDDAQFENNLLMQKLNNVGSAASGATKQFSAIDPAQAAADAAGTYLAVDGGIRGARDFAANRPPVTPEENVALGEEAGAVPQRPASEGVEVPTDLHQAPSATPAEPAITPRDPESPITQSPTTNKEPAITSPNRPAQPTQPAVSSQPTMAQPAQSFIPSAEADAPLAGVSGTNVPAYLRRQPLTVGQADIQARNGLYNVPDEMLSADARSGAAASDPADVPTFQRNNAETNMADAQGRIAQLDAQIANLQRNAGPVGQFNQRQAIADAFSQSPQKGRATAALVNARNASQDTEATLRDLITQRAQAQRDLVTAQNARDARDALEKAAQDSPAPSAESVPVETKNEAATKAAVEQAVPVTPEAVAAAEKQAEAAAPTEAIANNKVVQPESADEIPTADESTTAKTDNHGDVTLNPDAVARVDAAKRAFLSKTNVLRATKTNAGNELAGKMESAEDTHLDLTGKWMSQLHAAEKMSDAEKEQAWRLQEGEIDPSQVPQKIRDLVASIKTVNRDLYNKGTAVGINIGDKGDNYMPHVFDKNGPTVRMPQDASSDARKYGNLEKERTSDATNYSRKWDTYTNYLDRSAQRIAQAEQFGAKNEVAKALIGKVGAEGGDQAIADKAFSNYVNPAVTDSSLAKTSKGVRATMSALQLPTAAISHAAQATNVAADTGILNTAKALGKTIFKPGESGALAERAGVTTPQSLDHYSNEYSSFGSKLANKVTAPFLKPVMKFNRTVAANAYADTAAKMASKGDIQGLRDLGVKGDIGSTLTQDQMLQAVRGGTKRTMFVNSAADTPVNAETPMGKAIWQYRGAYARPQTGFIYNQILKPAAQGNLAPLLRYATLGTAGAAATTMAKNALTGRPNDPGSVASTVIPTMAGLPGEIANSVIQYGPKNPVGTAASIIAPVAGEAAKLLTAAGQAASGKSVTPLERYGLEKVPIVGSRLATTLTPTKAQQDAANNPGQQPGGSNPIGDFINGIFHPTPPDAATTEMQRLANDNGVKFTTAESNALKAKNVNPVANALINDPLYQAADDQSKLTMLRNVLHGTATKGINGSLGNDDKQALLDYNVQNATDKKAWLDDNHNASKYYTALYNNAVANKSIDPKLDNDLASKSSLKYKMVAAQVDEKYNNGEGASPELRTDYAGTSQAKFIQMLNPKSATYDPDAAKALADYDQARADAGLPPKYNMDVVQNSLAKAATSGVKKAQTQFTFANLPTSLIGTKGGTSSTGGGYAKDTPLFTPIASLKAPAATPTVAAIPDQRSISVVKVKQV